MIDANIESKANDLRMLLEKAAIIPPDSVIQQEALGRTLSFQPAIHSFMQTVKLFNKLRDFDLVGLPRQALIDLTNIVKLFLDLIRRIHEFSANSPQAAHLRQILIDECNSFYDNNYQQISGCIALLSAIDDNGLVQNSLTKLERLEAEFEKNVKENEQYLAKVKEDAVSLLKDIKEVAAYAGVTEHSGIFSTQSVEHAEAANRWLFVTVILLIVALISAVCLVFIFSDANSFNAAQNIQLLVAKALGFIILFFAIRMCGKNYSAHKHNYVLNKHRQNALSTFKSFVSASTDIQTKEAVLLKATDAIFNFGSSGYGYEENDAGSNTQVLEIVRNLGKAS